MIESVNLEYKKVSIRNESLLFIFNHFKQSRVFHWTTTGVYGETLCTWLGMKPCTAPAVAWPEYSREGSRRSSSILLLPRGHTSDHHQGAEGHQGLPHSPLFPSTRAPPPCRRGGWPKIRWWQVHGEEGEFCCFSCFLLCCTLDRQLPVLSMVSSQVAYKVSLHRLRQWFNGRLVFA